MTLNISSVFTYDEDAGNYIQAVEAADQADTPGIGALEPATRQAINNFVVGCKQDGIWDAIKASCILAGAKTLEGSFIDLKSATKILTNNNFADGTYVGSNYTTGDYDRKTGLVGDKSTKYLDSGRASNADPQDNHHWAVFPTSLGGTDAFLIGTEYTSSAADFNGFYFSGLSAIRSRNSSGVGTDQALYVTYSPSKLIAASRNSATSFTQRYNSISRTANVVSYTPSSSNYYLYRRVNPSSPSYSNARLAFYSIGESLDLAKLDSRVTDLITAFGAAIP